MKPRRPLSSSFVALGVAVLVGACGQTAEQRGDTVAAAETTVPKAPPFTPADFVDSVAAAHGFADWSRVRQLDFTFRVARGGEVAAEREWRWFPYADSVVLVADGASTSYLRNTELDSAALAADGNFINDSYWLLMPFYLEWSKTGFTSTVVRGATMPLSGAPATKLTVLYDDAGGYTPGDAYDLYVDDEYLVREWIFRKKNADEPSMTMSWEGYAVLNGMQLPGTHKSTPELGLEISHPGTNLVLQ